MSKSFYNSGSAATPAGIDGTFPVHAFAAAAPGAVPAGSIMVPTVGGNPVRYQADRCARPWKSATGALSQAGCQYSMFLPAIPAGGLEQVVWTVEASGYPASDTCKVGNTVYSGAGLVNCITQNSNLNMALAQVNQTYPLVSGNVIGAMFGVYVSPSTGAVTGGTIASGVALGQSFCGGNSCTATIAGPGCTGSPSATFTLPATVTVNTAGSGCAIEGSGNAMASVNLALSNGAYSGANQCGIVRQYLAGPVADGWEVACRFVDNLSGAQWAAPFPLMRAWVEDYKNTDGTVYAIRAAAAAVEDEVDLPANNSFPTYTVDVDWFNGSSPTSTSCIRCVGIAGAASRTNSLNYLPFTRLLTMGNGGIWSFGGTAQMDWVPVNGPGASNAALQAVVPTMQSSDKTLFKAAQVLPPFDDRMMLQSPVLTATGDQNLADDKGFFVSGTLGDEDCVNGWGTTGNHCWLSPVPSNGVNYYVATTSATDYGLSWLQNLRVAAATQFSCQAGYYEYDTRNPANYIPASVWTPPAGMTDPVRTRPVNGPYTGLVCYQFSSDWSTIGRFNGTADHYSVFGYPLYIYEGDEWELQEIDAAVQNITDQASTSNYGGTTYYSEPSRGGNSTRNAAWTLNPMQTDAKFLPSGDIAAQYITEVLLGQTYPDMGRFVSHTGSDIDGTWNWQTPSLEPGTKPADYTANGYPVGPFTVAAGNGGENNANGRNFFMDMYYLLVGVNGQMLFQNESPALTAWLDASFFNYAANLAALNANCLYNIVEYYGVFGDNNYYPFPGWEMDNGNPAQIGYNLFNRPQQNIFESFAGQQEVMIAPWVSGYGSFEHVTTTNSSPITVSASGSTTIPLSGLSAQQPLQIGMTVLDAGSNQCGGACPGTGGAVPTGTGAIPNYFYVSAINNSNNSITITCGAGAGCASPSATVNNGDTLVFGLRIDYPDSNVGMNPLPPQAPMPAGTLIKMFYDNDTDNGESHLGAFPPPLTPSGTLDIKATNAPYVWCPDSANPNGTTGFINAPGTTCAQTASRVTFASTSAALWGFAPPVSACPAGGNWANGGASSNAFGPQDYINNLLGDLRYGVAVLGGTTATTAGISALAANTSVSEYATQPGSTYWAFDSAFTPTPPRGR